MNKKIAVSVLLFSTIILASCNSSTGLIGTNSTSGTGVTKTVYHTASIWSKVPVDSLTGSKLQDSITTTRNLNLKLSKLNIYEIAKIDCKTFITGISDEDIKRCESIKKREQRYLGRISKKVQKAK